MRCLVLADELKERQAQILFVGRQLPAYLQEMLRAKGHEYTLLNGISCEEVSSGLEHAEWLGTTQHEDARETQEALSGKTWDWLIVDHYALDVRWESELRKVASNILVIDDLADRQHDCDVLLDQNYYEDMETRYTGKVPLHCRLLLGSKYVLLRKEFTVIELRKRNGNVRRILLFFGGVDEHNYTGCAINALIEIGIDGVYVDVVIGPQHPNGALIKEVCAREGFHCYVQTDKMAELMGAADLVLGAGGSSLWERAVLGVPSLVAITAANQTCTTLAVANQGACHLINEIDAATSGGWVRVLQQLLGDPGKLRYMTSQGMKLVQDANGCKRVSNAMKSVLRLAIVTGHSRGLGAALIQQLLSHGVESIGIARSQVSESDGLHQIRVDLNSFDFSWLSALDLHLQNLLKEHHEILFFNNAAEIQPIALTHQLSPSDIDRSYSINVRAPILLAGKLAHYCQSHGHKLIIINISSGAADKPIAGWGLYCSQKAAVRQVFDVIGIEYTCATVHHIDPGVMDTAMQDSIRKTSEAIPSREYFMRLKDEGLLQQPGVVASQILSTVLVK